MMPAGRPSKYNEEVLQVARDYLTNHATEHGHKLPTISGLSLVLKVHKDTLYEWAKHPDKAEFSDALSNIMQLQHQELIDKGLDGTYNATIAKLILATNHGFADKSETKHDVTDPLKELLDQIGKNKKVIGDG